MFALSFKCLDLFLLLLHGEPESQDYNHSNQGLHTHLFIYLVIYLFTYLFNLAGEFPSLLAHFDTWPWSSEEQHGQVTHPLPPQKKPPEKTTKIAEAWLQYEGFRREDSSNLHLCGKKGLRLQDVTNLLSHTQCVVLHENGAPSDKPRMH